MISMQSKYFQYIYELELSLDKLRTTHEIVHIDYSKYYDIIRFPAHLHRASFSSLYIYFDARCNGGWDRTCPQWDKLLSLFVCLTNATATATAQNDPCISPVTEILRTVTSYRRPHTGLKDITPLLSFFSQVRDRTGTLENIKIWGDIFPFTYNITLFFKTEKSVSRPLPYQAWTLWDGWSGYDSNYNMRQKDYNMTIPGYVKQLMLTGYITGHGWGTGKSCNS